MGVSPRSAMLAIQPGRSRNRRGRPRPLTCRAGRSCGPGFPSPGEVAALPSRAAGHARFARIVKFLLIFKICWELA
jgi:hypothetical protein